MPQIPLATRRVAQTTATSGAMSSGDAAAAPYRAISQLGGVVGQIGQKMQVAKEKAEAADYNVRLSQFKRGLADKELAAMTDPDNPISYNEVHDKVYKPELERFKKEIGGYGKHVQGKWAMEEERIITKQQHEQRARTIDDYSIRMRNSMWEDMNANTEDSRARADETFQDIVGLVGLEKAEVMRNRGEYNRELNIINELTSIDAIEAYEIGSKDPGHRQALITQKANRKNAIASQAVKTYIGTASEFSKGLEKGEILEQSIQAVKAAGGSDETEAAMREAVAMSVAEDNPKLVKKGYDYVKEFNDPSNAMTMDKAIGKIMKLKISTTRKSDMVAELMDAGETIGAKSSIINVQTGSSLLGVEGKRMSVQTTSGYKSAAEEQAFTDWDKLYDSVLAKSKGKKEFEKNVDLMMDSRKRLVALRKKYPDGITKKEWADERANVLGPMAEHVAMSYTAPQLQKKEEKVGPKKVKRKTKDGRTAVFNAETKEFIGYE